MSPLVFLAIPLVVFLVGSAAIWLVYRWRTGADFGLRRLPDNLRTVAPMVRDQRQTGWQSGVDDRTIRS